ncbi:MAG: hypothetical protein ACRETU_10375, partial [Steroidobacterales bacterium]
HRVGCVSGHTRQKIRCTMAGTEPNIAGGSAARGTQAGGISVVDEAACLPWQLIDLPSRLLLRRHAP